VKQDIRRLARVLPLAMAVVILWTPVAEAQEVRPSIDARIDLGLFAPLGELGLSLVWRRPVDERRVFLAEVGAGLGFSGYQLAVALRYGSPTFRMGGGASLGIKPGEDSTGPGATPLPRRTYVWLNVDWFEWEFGHWLATRWILGGGMGIGLRGGSIGEYPLKRKTPGLILPYLRLGAEW